MDGLKKRLDEKGQIIVQSFNGHCYTAGFTFNDPTTQENINKFTFETGWIVPDDYKDFLFLNNGATFFSYEYGDAFFFYTLEEIANIYNKELHGENFYPIGRCVDRGDIVIDNSRCKKKLKNYLLLNGIEIVDFQCNFKTWLDRMIVTQGECYWEWSNKIINPLIP